MINVYFSELPKTLTEILGLKYDETMSYEERVNKRHSYIKEQLEKNPGYEGWDYTEYVWFDPSKPSFVNFHYFISTKGRILNTSLVKGKYPLLKGTISNLYKSVQLKTMDTAIRFHRLVCSTFLPDADNRPLSGLHINHKDLNKLNNHFTNLEWCTHKENVRHAISLGAQKARTYQDRHYFINWQIDDDFYGQTFYVGDFKTLLTLGLDPSAIRHSLKKENKYSYGGNWTLVKNKDDVVCLPLPDFIKNKFLYDKPYLDQRSKAILGINAKTDEKICMIGGDEIRSRGFIQSCVHEYADTGKIAMGYYFYVITKGESNKYR